GRHLGGERKPAQGGRSDEGCQALTTGYRHGCFSPLDRLYTEGGRGQRLNYGAIWMGWRPRAGMAWRSQKRENTPDEEGQRRIAALDGIPQLRDMVRAGHHVLLRGLG